MDPIDRRRTKRKDINLKGNFKIKDDSKYRLHIFKEPADLLLADVGSMGCGFITAYYLPKGLVVNMKVRDFPVIAEKGRPTEMRDIDITARVMTCKTTPTRVNRIGVEFLEVKEEHLNFIKKYIAEPS